MGKAHGFGAPGGARCGATTRAGTPCKNPPAHGTPKCHKHGAYRYKKAPAHPKPERWAALRELTAIDIDPELTRRPEWQAATQPETRLAVAMAWQAAQDGNPAPWRNLTTPPNR